MISRFNIEASSNEPLIHGTGRCFACEETRRIYEHPIYPERWDWSLERRRRTVHLCHDCSTAFSQIVIEYEQHGDGELKQLPFQLYESLMARFLAGVLRSPTTSTHRMNTA